MVGEYYLPADMPEPPKESFFKGLFGGGVRNLDREELCKLSSSRSSYAYVNQAGSDWWFFSRLSELISCTRPLKFIKCT